MLFYIGGTAFFDFHPFPPFFKIFLLIFTMDSHPLETLVWAFELG